MVVAPVIWARPETGLVEQFPPAPPSAVKEGAAAPEPARPRCHAPQVVPGAWCERGVADGQGKDGQPARRRKGRQGTDRLCGAGAPADRRPANFLGNTARRGSTSSGGFAWRC